MKCPFCEREITIEYENQNEGYGILQKRWCPKCHTFLGYDFLSFNQRRDFKEIKEILEEKEYDKFRPTQKVVSH